jgi:hypothetical protein
MKAALGDVQFLLLLGLLGATAVFFFPFCYGYLLCSEGGLKNTWRPLQLKAERVERSYPSNF